MFLFNKQLIQGTYEKYGTFFNKIRLSKGANLGSFKTTIQIGNFQ